MTTLQNTTVFKSAMRQTLTYGVLPNYQAFEAAFTDDLGPDGIYQIRNCKELEAVNGGDADYTCEELWSLVEGCVQNLDSNHECEDLASSILYTLGFKWV